MMYNINMIQYLLVQDFKMNLPVHSILGVITSSKRTPIGEGSVFTINDRKTGGSLTINCPFFLPARKDDVIAGLYIKQNNEQLELIQDQVLIEPSSTREAVQNVFLIGMGKLRMSQYLSNQVYDFFMNEAKFRIKDMTKKPDCGSSESTIFRNREFIQSAVMETISWYANNFRTDQTVAQPLINLGLSIDQAHKLLTSWYKGFCLRRLYLLGLNRTEIKECCDRGWADTKGISNSPDALYYQLIENPYIPEKIPLTKAKSICQRYGLSFGQDMIESADLIRFVDAETSENGSVCFPIFSLIKRYPRFNELCDTLKLKFKCTIRYNFFYLRHQADMEDTLVKYLESKSLPPTHISAGNKLRFCPEQIEAIELALNNTVSIITGAGGVGKTRIISGLVEEFDLREIPWCIGSFTGKAIANVKKIIRRRDNIMTLNMILSKGKIVDFFERPVRILIIDEISMVPNELLSKVILKLNNALPEGQTLHIVLVGDPNQVQPIEPGDFFNQAMKSWIFEEDSNQGKLAIPCIKLLEDHRRTDKDGVLYNNMNQFSTAETPEDIDFQWGSDCEFIQGGVTDLENVVIKLKQNGIPSDDITIISPINGKSGSAESLEAINLKVRDIFIPQDTETINDSFGKFWKLGDRVMMTVNRYDINIMNGEEGEIIEVMREKSNIKVKFQNGHEVDIPTYLPIILDDLPEPESLDFEVPLSTKLLILSWAITVHKAQGSQNQYIIFQIPKSIGKGSFFNRNLLYTGASRAMKHLTVIASHECTFTSAIQVNPPKRYDNLAKRLIKEPYVDYYVNPAHVRQQEMMQKAMTALAK